MRAGTLDTSLELIPEQRTLVAYAFFYLCGWLLYGEADLLERFPRFAWTHVVLGLALVPVTLAALLQAGQPFVVRNTPQHLTAIVSGGVSVWLLIFGILGLFWKYARRTAPVVTYLADASYWMYLAHLPVVIWLHVLLEGWQVNGLVKYLVVVGITMFVLLVSYEYLVRKTLVGTQLNGSASKAAASKSLAATA
jgi:glucan biosynthesis protein C